MALISRYLVAERKTGTVLDNKDIARMFQHGLPKVSKRSSAPTGSKTIKGKQTAAVNQHSYQKASRTKRTGVKEITNYCMVYSSWRNLSHYNQN